MYKGLLKPVFDFIIALVSIIIISPVLMMVGIALAFQNKGTPFFLQNRPGKNQKAFNIIKFKTMTDERAIDGKLLPDNQRITRLGNIIRKLSIDELPQLLNVLKGDMSLVGPRPLLFKYMPLYSKEQLRRHDLKPGITGWAQVNGRNAISWAKKFELDVYYVDHISFTMDTKILWLTVLKVIKKEGVNQSDEAPMQPFNGTN
jgi:undecaprenyl phosphate N,N'-diacetylbacillosamine 1-phosphate transferase